MRLVSLIAFAIALILILIFAVRSCESSSESAAYKNYMDKVATIAADSASVGTNLSKLLDRQDLQEKLVETNLNSLISQQEIDINNASKLSPPGPLRQQHDQMLEALQLRQNALTGLLTVFRDTQAKRGATAATKAGVALSQQMLRGVASDVLWQDMFVTPALDVLKRQGISGAPPPNSVFVADPTRATVTSMVSVWQRWHGVQTSNTSGTVHGTNIEYVKVMPASETLTQGSIKTIKIRKDLAFVVGVKNGGDFLESDIKVTLQINQKTQPIKKVFTIGSIYSGATTDVIFKNFAITDPINILPVKVDVAPVPSETNKANNQATYEVRFSF